MRAHLLLDEIGNGMKRNAASTSACLCVSESMFEQMLKQFRYFTYRIQYHTKRLRKKTQSNFSLLRLPCILFLDHVLRISIAAI